MESYKRNFECYDVFNDYLGLSSVVGQQERHHDGMESTSDKGCAQNVSASANRSDDPFGNTNGTRRFRSDSNSSLECRSSPSSDVERLFGNAPMFRTDVTPIAKPTSHIPKADHGSPGHCSFTNVPIDKITGHCKQTKVDAMNATLDSIIKKYNTAFAQKKQNHDHFPSTSNQLMKNSDDWISVTALRKLLMSAACSIQVKPAQNIPTNCTSKPFLICERERRCLYSRSCCSFCKNNKETEAWYMGHNIKDPSGKVTCPILRNYICPLCNATGDAAHTVGHCPWKTSQYSLPLAIRSKANSAGKRKYT